MIKKIRFYKKLIIEIIETLCSICLYLEEDSYKHRNSMGVHMRSHFSELKKYSETMRKEASK